MLDPHTGENAIDPLNNNPHTFALIREQWEAVNIVQLRTPRNNTRVEKINIILELFRALVVAVTRIVGTIVEGTIRDFTINRLIGETQLDSVQIFQQLLFIFRTVALLILNFCDLQGYETPEAVFRALDPQYIGPAQALEVIRRRPDVQ